MKSKLKRFVWCAIMIKVRIKLYARLADLAGVSDLKLELPEKARLRDLLETLYKRFGETFESVVTTPSAEYGHYIGVILINERESSRLSGADTELGENDVVRIIPPVSGG